MEPRHYAAALRKFWGLILLLALAGGAGAFFFAQGTEPNYRATSKVYVTVERGQTVSELVQGDAFAQNAVQSYSQLVTMPIVLDPVIARLGLDVTARELARSVSADTPLDTVIIEISAVNPDPVLAARISNTVAQSLAATVDDIAPRTDEGTSSVAVRVVEPADTPLYPFEPNSRLMIATGIIAGLGIGFALALVIQTLDTKVRNDKDVERVTDATVLGSVARTRDTGDSRIVMLSRPRSPQAESYRKIRANLQFVNAAVELRSLVITSARAGEGKSTAAANLALAMAERDVRVLLVDADLRRSNVAKLCGLEGSVGLTTVLIGEAELDDVLQPWADTGVTVLTAGAVPPNPLQLLDSPAMAELLDELTVRFDVVLLDAPPVLPVADAAVLSRLAAAALVVVGAGRTTRQQLRKVLESLGSVGANVAGVVVTRASRRDAGGRAGYEYVPSTMPTLRRRPDRGASPRGRALAPASAADEPVAGSRSRSRREVSRSASSR
jgi:capsular exopolysaccharide synthesis family protein